MKRVNTINIFVTDVEGERHTLEAPVGWSVMEVIFKERIPMKAECGGCCSCATCHVYVDEAWIAMLPARSCEEEECLDEAFNVDENSRLSCQIILTKEMDGLRLKIA